jgi:hypothetical protein
MTTPRFEQFLARLYVDEDVRRRFASDPRGTATGAGLTSAEIEALAAIDWTGLELASRSYAHKRRANVRGACGWSALVRSPLRTLARAFGLRL